MKGKSKLAALTAMRLRLADRGYLPATSGNLSVRLQADPLLFAVTASGLDKGQIGGQDSVLVDGRLNLQEVGSLRPSAEAIIHARLYEANPGIGAVLHVHTVAATVVSLKALVEGEISFTGLEMLKALGCWPPKDRLRLPVVENYSGMERLAEAVITALEPEVPAILIAGHGLTAWGQDLPEALKHLEAVQFLLETNLALHNF